MNQHASILYISDEISYGLKSALAILTLGCYRSRDCDSDITDLEEHVLANAYWAVISFQVGGFNPPDVT